VNLRSAVFAFSLVASGLQLLGAGKTFSLPSGERTAVDNRRIDRAIGHSLECGFGV